jgi:hypothetical protein
MDHLDEFPKLYDVWFSILLYIEDFKSVEKISFFEKITQNLIFKKEYAKIRNENLSFDKILELINIYNLRQGPPSFTDWIEKFLIETLSRIKTFPPEYEIMKYFKEGFESIDPKESVPIILIILNDGQLIPFYRLCMKSIKKVNILLGGDILYSLLKRQQVDIILIEELIDVLIDKGYNLDDISGFNPFITSIYRTMDNLHLIKFLFDRGVSINKFYGEIEQTPTHFLCTKIIQSVEFMTQGLLLKVDSQGNKIPVTNYSYFRKEIAFDLTILDFFISHGGIIPEEHRPKINTIIKNFSD